MRRLLKFLLLCLPLAAQAETYRVDLIVFLDKSAALIGGAEQGRAPQPPDLRGALELDHAGPLKSAGIEILPDDQFALNDQWQRLKTSKRFAPLIKLAWTQQDPPAERAAALHLKWGSTFAVDQGNMSAALLTPVDGSVGLLLGHYLHLDVDLAYTQKSETGIGAYRLRENRQMKRDELHHLDSARLGVLARVSKAAP